MRHQVNLTIPPAPYSLRLTDEQKARLRNEAGGTPLGTYIKAKVLGTAPLKRAASIGDRQALSQALALLGQSRIASNLNQLAHLGNIGALPVSPEIEAELVEAGRLIKEIRRLLIQATGLQPEG